MKMISAFSIVHGVGKGKETQPVHERAQITERVRGTAFEPARRPSRFTTENYSLFPALSKNCIQLMCAPHSQQVDYAPAVDPHHILSEQVRRDVGHVGLVEQGKVTCLHIGTGKGSIECVDTGRIVACSSRYKAQLRPGRIACQLKCVAENRRRLPRLSRPIESHGRRQDSWMLSSHDKESTQSAGERAALIYQRMQRCALDAQHAATARGASKPVYRGVADTRWVSPRCCPAGRSAVVSSDPTSGSLRAPLRQRVYDSRATVSFISFIAIFGSGGDP